MSDIILKIRAEELGKSLENLAPQVEEELNGAIENLANVAYSSMVAKVQSMSMNPKNRQDYLRALQFQKLGDSEWLIYLDGEWANKLEEGFAAYDMKEVLLNSTKTVQVGSRAGQPWVQKSKDGKTRYAFVPFEHKPFSKEAATGDLASAIRSLTAKNVQGIDQKLTQIFKDAGGSAIGGKVASVRNTGIKNLDGITKYQWVSDTGNVSSVYMTFRTISDKSQGWKHPGFEGYGIFDDTEKFIEEELERIITELL